MLNDLKNFLQFLSTEKEGKKLIKWFFTFFIVAILLITLNKAIINQYLDQDYFVNHWALARLTFQEGVNPYQRDIFNIMRNGFPKVFVDGIYSDFIFQLPIYQLFLFFPFAYIKDVHWAVIIWLTVLQLILLGSTIVFIRMYKIELSLGKKIVFACFALLFYPNFINLLMVNLAIVHLSFFLLSLYFYQEKKFIISGILLGLLSIDPFHFFVPIITFLFLILNDKRITVIYWAIITIILLIIAGVIFQPSWILEMTRNVVLERNFYPFLSYSEAFSNKIELSIKSPLIEIIPIALLLWISYEFIRTPKATSTQKTWILCFSFLLNSIILLRNDPHTEILFFPVYVFIVALWTNRSKGIFNWIISGTTVVISVLIPYTNIAIDKILKREFISDQTLFLINLIFMVIMLYWVRLWLINDFTDQNREPSI
jgi:hypothetical protein